MIETREAAIRQTIGRVAQQMATAAISAPKASGKDNILAWVLTGEDKAKLADHMRAIYRETGAEFFNRDAGNVDASEAVVIVGARNVAFGLEHCGYCGFEDCGKMARSGGRCALIISDLGIAVGSAVSIAADCRIDNRVMFSAGQAAQRMDFMDPKVKVSYGIPLSASSKSIYFDRDPGAVLL